MNDTPTEERIEEMLEVEYELAEQYEEHLSDDPKTPDEDDRPADSRLDEYTGRVVEFERETKSRTMSHHSSDHLRIKLLLHDGTRLGTTIDWPDDPTDETEELVRLCNYLDVPIDRLGDLQGKYVPMKPRETYSEIEIPPIPTQGNRLVYWCRRTARSYNLAWAVPSVQSVTGLITTALAFYCAYSFHQIPDHPTNFGAVLLIGGLVLAAVSVILLLRPVYYGLEYVYNAANALFRRFFPKP